MKIKKIYFIFFWAIAACASDEGVRDTEVRKGNFALPTSQQPAPLISFGQNIIAKNDVMVFLYGDWIHGNNSQLDEIDFSFLYGLTDTLSLFVNFPFAFRNQADGTNTPGMEDLSIQFEYAFYTHNDLLASKQATFVANMTFPTGITTLPLPSGFGSPSFFLGFTYAYLDVDWGYYTSNGVVLTTKKNKTKFGNQILYQAGAGRNLHHMKNWILYLMLEFNGFYIQRPTIDGVIDQNSGGNIIYLGPSLWLSNEKFIFQAGVSGVPYQKLFGIQPKQNLFAAFDIIYKFN